MLENFQNINKKIYLSLLVSLEMMGQSRERKASRILLFLDIIIKLFVDQMLKMEPWLVLQLITLKQKMAMKKLKMREFSKLFREELSRKFRLSPEIPKIHSYISKTYSLKLKSVITKANTQIVTGMKLLRIIMLSLNSLVFKNMLMR